MRNEAIKPMLVVAALALSLTACGSTTPPTQTPDQLFSAYLNSTTVKNDQYRGSTSADRLAEFAAEGTPSDIGSAMFGVRSCESAQDLGCPPSASATAAAARFAGSAAPLHVRTILIQHQGGALELMPLYVTANAAGATELIDAGGQAYPGGMPDFQRHNTLLTDDDVLLAPDNITATAATFRLVVLPGHVADDTTSPWVITVLAVLIAIVASTLVLTLLRLRHRRREE